MNGPTSPRPRGFHLVDLCALVLGYGMASLLVRAFWPSGEGPTVVEAVVIGLFYSWLGLAMSGPLVLLFRRPASPPVASEGGGEDQAAGAVPVKQAPAVPGAAHTWAELAWLIIGFYWIVLTVLAVPVRLNRSPLPDAALVGLFPIAAALILQRLDRRSRRPRPGPGDAPAWTHRAAVGLLLTWPLAWIALILLGKSLL
jgi:hypothetical protein